MKLVDVLIIVIIAAVVITAYEVRQIRRKKGKSCCDGISCGGDCKTCGE